VDATVADWITAGFTAVLALFTLALVVTTVYYAIQTKRTVDEMRTSRMEAQRSREQSVRPRLALDFERLGGSSATLTVWNVGQGAALHADLSLAFVARNGEEERRPWQPTVLAPGARQRFALPESLDMNLFAPGHTAVIVTGHLHDVLGCRHEVNEQITDVFERWERTKEALRLFPPEPVVTELEKLRQVLKGKGPS